MGAQNGRVIVGVHTSVGGYQAMRYAAVQARERGEPLLVVYAVRVGAGAAVQTQWEFLAAAARDEVAAAFAEALGGPPGDLSIQTIIERGTPGEVLTGVADRETDVIVIGGSGRRRFGRRRAGVARDCARLAGCPVVIVPPPALARTGGTRRLARAAASSAEELLCEPDPKRRTAA